MYLILYFPASTSLCTVSPMDCSNVPQTGQRESSYSSRVFFAVDLPMTTVVPFLPEVFLGAATFFASLAASQPDGLFSCMTPQVTPPTTASTPTIETPTMTCRMDLVLLGLALALGAQSLAGRCLVGLGVALAHVRISME